MLYFIILYYIILYHIILYYIILYYIILYYIILYSCNLFNLKSYRNLLRQHLSFPYLGFSSTPSFISKDYKVPADYFVGCHYVLFATFLWEGELANKGINAKVGF